jgi:sterol desaturase/sphingolipid hydroxylase (fatty acid hydroxylase superfamily)
MAAEYAHPVETVALGIGTFLGPLFFGTHVIQLHLWLLVRLFQTIEAHVGYDLPISPRQFLPFYGGAEYHDFHHETFSGNYSSSFIVWDYVFGTDVKYRQRREKLRAKGAGPLMSIWDFLLYDRLFRVPSEVEHVKAEKKVHKKAN